VWQTPTSARTCWTLLVNVQAAISHLMDTIRFQERVCAHCAMWLDAPPTPALASASPVKMAISTLTISASSAKTCIVISVRPASAHVRAVRLPMAAFPPPASSASLQIATTVMETIPFVRSATQDTTYPMGSAISVKPTA
jgi:hypothetical protein